MKYALFGTDVCEASIAILVKETGFNQHKIEKTYITPIKANKKAFIAFSLWCNTAGKIPVTEAKEQLDNLLTELKKLNIQTIIVTDSVYFKLLTDKKGAEKHIGYVLSCTTKHFKNDFNVLYMPSYQILYSNPNKQELIDKSLNTMISWLQGKYTIPGQHIIHSAQYPTSELEVQKAYSFLLTKPELTIDIETKGLEFWNCGISTIAFAWDKHNFISFAIDRSDKPVIARTYLWTFLKAGKRKLILHNANFDFKVLVYQLWMLDTQDYKGMIEGIQSLTENFEDTKLIAYLSTNNAAENVLKLKVLAADFTGNYEQEEISDTENIPLPELLEYNGVDTLATWYVFNKHYPVMVKDDQLGVYTNLLKPSVITLLQMELCGMPVIPEKILEVKSMLTEVVSTQLAILDKSSIIKDFQYCQLEKIAKKYTAKAKKKIYTVESDVVKREKFNPSSYTQKAILLYDYLGLPILDYTKSKQPSSGGKTLKKLLNHTKNTEYLELINTFIELASAEKILTTFIPAFEKAIEQPDETYRLYGNFNIGGTVSGRLSSSSPNLTNIPSNSKWGKLIKSCFGFATKDWLYAGADFSSLEDRISALTTKDKNKLKVYTDGYDGHSLRAYTYFKDQLPDILDTVESINSIADIHPDLRQASKEPTFLLTYRGTYHGLMNSLGLEEVSAKIIEKNYHILYAESDKWIEEHIKQACIDGYVTGAFGLRLRTPLLAQNTKGRLSYQAEAEGRTAGNMLGQSYGMLNSRAANEFRERIWKSEYRYSVFLCCQIHDACYVYFKNKAKIAKWVNDNLIACMKWCELDEIKHPIVKLGAELDLFYPNWAKPTKIPNSATSNDIYNICKRSLEDD